MFQIGVLTRRLYNIPIWDKNKTSFEYQCYTGDSLSKTIIVENKIPNLEWYTGLSQTRKVQPRCPFASVETCPRYFQSLSLLGCAGSTSIDDAEENRLIDYWKKSDLWPKTGEYETSVAGPKDNPRIFTNFCPEIAYDRFGYFATFLAGYADEIDSDAAHARLTRLDASKNDWRWSWSSITQLHYCDCHYFSLLDHRSKNNRFPFSAEVSLGVPGEKQVKKAPKILLADDDQLILAVYGQFFILCGFDVKTAKNGAECIELLKKETFHVAVLDIFMLPINGLEVAKFIQSEGIDTDVILLTGNASLEVAVTAIRAGVKDLFQKINSDKDKGRLLNKVKSLIRNKKTPTTVRAAIENMFKENISETIDLIENTLRSVIDKRLKEFHGNKFWKTTIPGDIQEKVKKRIDEQIKKYPWLKPFPDKSSFNKWDFCDVGDYLKIILKNWNLFQDLFLQKEGLSQHFKNFSNIRNSVKHNRSMNEVEVKLGEASIIWLARTLEIS